MMSVGRYRRDEGCRELRREIILLRTPKNTGKSSSIKMLWKCVRNLHEPASPLADCSNGDIRGCIKLNDSNIIGFASAGDDEKTVASNCCFFEKHRCNICVTACPTRGNTWQKIEGWAKKNAYGISLHDYVVPCKSEQADSSEEAWQRANKEKVRMMLTRVEYLIGSSGCDDS